MAGYLSREIFSEVFEKAPERFVGDTYFENVERTVYAWADEFENWIDPDSDYYRESLWEAGQRGADEVKDAVLVLLADAVYRRDLFGTPVDVDALLERVKSLEVQPDMEGV